jgi:RNA polymerase sigma-70 factor (ECF subfamily)
MEDCIEDNEVGCDHDPPDWTIVEKVMAGDVNQFETLLKRHSSGVFRIIARRIPAQDVESVAQEVFVTAFQSLRTYAGRQPFEHWVARIARRRACDYWRQRKPMEVLAAAFGNGGEWGWIESAASALAIQSYRRERAASEVAEEVRKSLRDLNAEERALMESIYFEEIPLREVAATFGWSLAKTKIKAYRIRKRLRAMLVRVFRAEERT